MTAPPPPTFPLQRILIPSEAILGIEFPEQLICIFPPKNDKKSPCDSIQQYGEKVQINYLQN